MYKSNVLLHVYSMNQFDIQKYRTEMLSTFQICPLQLTIFFIILKIINVKTGQIFFFRRLTAIKRRGLNIHNKFLVIKIHLYQLQKPVEKRVLCLALLACFVVNAALPLNIFYRQCTHIQMYVHIYI